MGRANKRPVAVTTALLRRWRIPNPGSSGDKEDRGVALVIGGAAEVPGSILLAGVAALRVGAGKLQLAGPRSAATSLGVAVPEARVFPLPESDDGFLDRKSGARAADLMKEADAVLVGPGMMNDDAVRDFMDEVIRRIADKPIVIDALALSVLRDQRYRFPEKTRAVLTPNLEEMAGISGDKAAAIKADPGGVALAVARDLNAVIALKGSETFIATPDGKLFQYAKADVGLATSGSGDVLAGAIVGLIARGATLDQAAAWAVYLHGAAGNRLKRRIGRLGFLARELSDEIAPLMNSLNGERLSHETRRQHS
ncbi:MAG TPA: NAD(P)H-hydrate dehydratase [Gemmatimonadaceae bacterium]|nr:NAD(P)H-hydrate dehydratase [Gemmatimonadaceae bacterium]